MSDRKKMTEKWKIRFGLDWYDNIYAEYMECSNCGATEQLLIRKGIPKSEVPALDCDHCGCKTLVLA